MHDQPRIRRSAMQHSSTRYVGLDVPNDATAVASVATAHEAEVIDLGTSGTRQGDIDQLVRTRSTPAGPRPTRPSSGGRHRPGTGGLSVGHRQPGVGDTVRLIAGSSLDPQRRRVTTSIGRGAAPVWCHPRRREETSRPTRASSEAGTRRRPVRWEPTHGYPRDQPSDGTGSPSADGQHQPEDLNRQITS